MNIEKITYRGWKDCVLITNETIQLIVTTQVGPRIIFLGYRDGNNLFYEHPDQIGTTGGSEWKIYGGHRLWCAPEDRIRTYVPDNFPILFESGDDYVRFIAPVEDVGIRKTIEIKLPDMAARAVINHIVENTSTNPIELAPWGISVMRPGGVAIVPHNINRSDQLLPTHSLSLWNYSRLSDHRWTWGDQFILLKQDPLAITQQKFGCQNEYGWAGYAVDNQLFVKRFDWDALAKYPDYGSNCEVFTNPLILEIETLGPLCRVDPGKSVSHQEVWEIHSNVEMPWSEADVEKWVMLLVQG